MDPYIKGEDYGIESLVKKMYGTRQGGDYYKLFADAVAPGKYTGFRVAQSKD